MGFVVPWTHGRRYLELTGRWPFLRLCWLVTPADITQTALEMFENIHAKYIP